MVAMPSLWMQLKKSKWPLFRVPDTAAASLSYLFLPPPPNPLQQYGAWPQRKVEWQVKVLKKIWLFSFHFPASSFCRYTQQKQCQSPFLPIPPVPTPRVLTEPVFWQKSPSGTGKQTAKTWCGLEKLNENQPNYQRLLLLTVLSLNYFMGVAYWLTATACFLMAGTYSGCTTGRPRPQLVEQWRRLEAKIADTYIFQGEL